MPNKSNVKTDALSFEAWKLLPWVIERIKYENSYQIYFIRSTFCWSIWSESKFRWPPSSWRYIPFVFHWVLREDSSFYRNKAKRSNDWTTLFVWDSLPLGLLTIIPSKLALLLRLSSFSRSFYSSIFASSNPCRLSQTATLQGSIPSLKTMWLELHNTAACFCSHTYLQPAYENYLPWAPH